MKRYPMSRVQEAEVRQQALREGIRGQTDRNHNHGRQANLIPRTTALSNSMKGGAKLLSHFSRVRLCATPQTAAHQAPPSLGFSRQEHWSGLPFPSPMHESEK